MNKCPCDQDFIWWTLGHTLRTGISQSIGSLLPFDGGPAGGQMIEAAKDKSNVPTNVAKIRYPNRK